MLIQGRRLLAKVYIGALRFAEISGGMITLIETMGPNGRLLVNRRHPKPSVHCIVIFTAANMYGSDVQWCRRGSGCDSSPHCQLACSYMQHTWERTVVYFDPPPRRNMDCMCGWMGVPLVGSKFVSHQYSRIYPL